ncbi:hypothetical protein HK096_004526 [Nowakowskiella sp. JEL0078]|nr:hypothetical protein HK096_004526 [Nowakowskiella sp. JEL0078]
MTFEKDSKKTVLFLSNGHAGQLNSLIAIAVALWQKCDKENTEIVFACIPKYTPKDHLSKLIPGLKIIPLNVPPIESNNVEMLSDTFNINWIKNLITGLFDFDHFKDCHEKLEEYLRTASKKPDLVVLDIGCLLISIAFRKYGIPHAINIPLPAKSFLSSPILYSLSYPLMSSGFPLKMSFFQTLENFFFSIQLVFLAITHLVPLIRKTENYIKELPNADTFVTKNSGNRTVTKNAEFIFIDTIFGLDYPYKLPENTQLIGACLDPSALANTDPASKNDLEWISKWSNVVYISLGTISKPSKAYVINLLTSFQVARGLHQQRKSSDWFCIFKIPKGCYTPEDGDALLDNVRIVNWVGSQLDILRQPNVKIFVSHCGGNSVNEAVYFGKPILGIPQWYDCYDLAQRVQDAGIGLRVFGTVPEPSLAELQSKMLAMFEGLDGFLSASMKLKQEMRAAGGSEEAARKILEKISDRSLIN